MAMETIELIKQWATDRDLHASDPVKQLWKLVEENGELAAGVLKQKPEMIEDAAGDMVVVMTIMLMQLDGDIKEFIQSDLLNKKLEITDDDAMSNILRCIVDIDTGLKNNFNVRHIALRVDDIILYLHVICRNHDLFIHECIDVAYTEIKDRKGKTINGSFVKEADL